MSSGKPHAVFTTFLTGLVFLQPHSFAPEKEARISLPPDSLVRAVAAQDDLLFHVALAEGVDINSTGADGRTALLVAVDQNHRELIPRLLELGALAVGWPLGG